MISFERRNKQNKELWDQKVVLRKPKERQLTLGKNVRGRGPKEGKPWKIIRWPMVG
jgi:hypothetical protein